MNKSLLVCQMLICVIMDFLRTHKRIYFSYTCIFEFVFNDFTLISFKYFLKLKTALTLTCGVEINILLTGAMKVNHLKGQYHYWCLNAVLFG